jgi:tRNA(Ile)-lysidine synthase
LSDGELEEIFSPLASVRSLLLAVSGGSDSMALMHLAHDWARLQDNRPTLHVATVDHGLRAEALDECHLVAEQAARLGLSHHILTWHHDAPLDRNLQAKARDARYRLLMDYARSLDCKNIATAHHLDDQAETFLMRLIRGSGVSGLAAMAFSSSRDEFQLFRPFLTVPKNRLVASLKARNVDWCDDPSNLNDAFLRVRVRKILPDLVDEGCDINRLANTARRMARADEALEGISGEVFAQHFVPEPGRALSVDLENLLAQREEIRLRLLRLSLRYVAAPTFPPREEGLVSLDEALRAFASGKNTQKARLKRTLSGCCFDLRTARLWIYREPGREPRQVDVDPVGVTAWYNLYDVELLDRLEGVTFRPLGPEGRLALAKEGQNHARLLQEKETYPVDLIEACPALWQDARPIAVVDWPEIARKSGVRVDFRGKDPRFTFNQAFG